MYMRKYIYAPTYLLLLTIAFSSCNSTTQKMKDTETTIEDSTATTNTVPADSTIAKDTTEQATNVPLRVIIDNLSTNDGEIEIGVYTPENKFPDETAR